MAAEIPAPVARYTPGPDMTRDQAAAVLAEQVRMLLDTHDVEVTTNLGRGYQTWTFTFTPRPQINDWTADD